jgi:hypothetical protein
MKRWQRLALIWLLASTVACSDESTGTANDGVTNNGTGGDAGANGDPDGGSTGGTNGSDGGSSSAGVTGDELAVLAYCQTKFVRLASWEPWAAVCCDQAGTVHDTFPIGGFGLEYLDTCVLELQMPMKKGTLVFHRERAQACAMFQGRNFPAPYANCQTLPLDIFDAYFAAPSQTSADCIAAFEGTLTEGEECSTHVECAAGLACRHDRGVFTCRPKAERNGACSATEGCQDGLRCVGESGQQTCQNPMGEEGAACSVVYDCRAGLVCSPTSNECFEPSSIGEVCETSDDCTPNLRCGVGNTCEGEAPKADGGACTVDAACASAWCREGQCTAFCGESTSASAAMMATAS